MKQQITDLIHDAEALEKLYRANRPEFTKAFGEADFKEETELIRFWKIRLSSASSAVSNFSASGLLEVILIALLTAFLVKIPELFFAVDKAFYYPRDIAIIAFSGLIFYTFRQRKTDRCWTYIYIALILILALYVNLLPAKETDTLIITFLHVPLFLWCLFGGVFVSFRFRETGKWMEFLRYNGELLTMSGLLLITGGILTGITIGLFSAIGTDIEKIYFENIALPGATVSPILASYLIKLYPDITRRIVPVIARVFTPIVLVTLVIYLIFLAFSGVRILEDRNLLILFNVIMIAVMALIIFSITELDKTRPGNIHTGVLLILAIVTLVINALALTAITGRLTDGLTPNRVVVFITNVLIFVNLILIARDLFRSYTDARKLVSVENTVAKYLAVYFLWTVVAIFILPAIFGYN